MLCAVGYSQSMESVMANVRQAAPEPKEETGQEVSTENRGYWGYREITEEDIAKNGVDEGGCGCGCGGK